MKPEEIDSRILPADWAETPASVKAVVSELAERVRDLTEQYQLLSAQMQPLTKQMEALDAQLARKKRRTNRRGFGQSLSTQRR